MLLLVRGRLCIPDEGYMFPVNSITRDKRFFLHKCLCVCVSVSVHVMSACIDLFLIIA